MSAMMIEEHFPYIALLQILIGVYALIQYYESDEKEVSGKKKIAIIGIVLLALIVLVSTFFSEATISTEEARLESYGEYFTSNDSIYSAYFLNKGLIYCEYYLNRNDVLHTIIILKLLNMSHDDKIYKLLMEFSNTLIPKYILNDLNFVFVDHIDELIKEALVFPKKLSPSAFAFYKQFSHLRKDN